MERKGLEWDGITNTRAAPLSLLAEEDERGGSSEEDDVALRKVVLESVGQPVPLSRPQEGLVLPVRLSRLVPEKKKNYKNIIDIALDSIDSSK